MSAARVVVYLADGCHLCEAALELVEKACEARGLPVGTVRIDGDARLEDAYRERIPVVEVDGVVAFTTFVHRDQLESLLDDLS